MHRLRNLLGPLRVLDAVNRAGGVTRAAERLHITPGAVSHQLRALEAALQTRLFRKAGREIALTAPAHQLALRLADLFDRVEDAVAQATGAEKTRRIRLKVIPSFAIKWLMPRLAGFYALHGDIGLEVATVARADDVGLEDADFVVRRGDGRWPDGHAELLFDDALAVACTPAVAGQVREPRDVLQATLLHSMIAPASWEAWLRSAGVAGDPTPRYIPLANAALCLQAAVQGLDLALTQQAYMSEEIRSGALVHPFADVARSGAGYYLVCEPGTLDIPAYAAFAQWIRDSAQAPAQAAGAGQGLAGPG